MTIDWGNPTIKQVHDQGSLREAQTKMRTYRAAGLFLVMALLLCVLQGMALAETEGKLTIQVTTDQKEYQENEIATLKISVVNHTDQPIANLRMRNFLPEGLSYIAEDEMLYRFPTLNPGQMAFHTLRIQTKQAEGTLAIWVTTDQASYKKGEVATLTIQVANHTDQTIDDLQMQNILPSGLSYVPLSNETYKFPMIKAGDTAVHTLQVRLLQDFVPATGDDSNPSLWYLLAGTALLGMALLIKTKSRYLKASNHR